MTWLPLGPADKSLVKLLRVFVIRLVIILTIFILGLLVLERQVHHFQPRNLARRISSMSSHHMGRCFPYYHAVNEMASRKAGMRFPKLEAEPCLPSPLLWCRRPIFEAHPGPRCCALTVPLRSLTRSSLTTAVNVNLSAFSRYC